MSILSADKIKLNVTVKDKYEAIRIAGQLLVDAGHVSEPYLDAMIEREDSLSTYMGGGLAIPHGTKEAKSLITSTGLSVVVIPDGVEFSDGEKAYILVGIAAVGNEHMDILTNVAMIFSEDENVERIKNAGSAEEIIEIFESGMEE
ncbi:PTS sugar transporter subunit IIA [Paenibacillus sp. J22TS3]|uniref:PTS sugar transporter subunit IIA n=1 Tax=Paenibacillus sp. J22TS3 TaxID=2807192 RepID=UPI001B2D0F0E|nr:PTS sugar transporter subunit IIA [Paenibacillus sp. J22TS3]GIP21948.1 mannitol-specific phosphotransferase enzyme IIA component [Paenibacillus sp. J22TS3]